MQELHYTFYGCRGSYPVANKDILKYGGNTSSILVEMGEQVLIFDAGTGIINIGSYLKEKKRDIKKMTIFLTHLHLDHVQGLPFFQPIFDKNYEIDIYCPAYKNISLKAAVYSLFNHPFSPISNNGIKAGLNFFELRPEEQDTVTVDSDLHIEFIKENSHPICGVLIYKLKRGNFEFVFATDVESPDGFDRGVSDFIKGADVLIHDSQYFDHDYAGPKNSKKGFGHSTFSMAVRNALAGEVRKLFLFHYDPDYSDSDLERMLKQARNGFPETYLSEELKKFTIRS